MADWKLLLYHKSPSFVRNWIASARGYYLRSWRYGPETESLVAEALERDRWSPDQWKTYQENRLDYVLHRAATQVPFYKNQWAERKRNGDKASWGYLENWPILRKETLRTTPDAFVADDRNTDQMFREQTSGTSGTPLKLWWSRQTTRTWYALFEARIRRWNGVSIHDPWAILGGQQVVPMSTSKPPFWIWNRAMNQLYLSANHISTKNTPHIVDAMRRYNVTHLFTYSSSATYLAQQMLDLNLSLGDQIRVVITNAEPLFDWQRIVLEKAFNAPVRETYGMGEIVATASADKEGQLRLWPEVGLIEVHSDTEDNRHLPIGESGRLICTGLFNIDMPLIRYEVGDRGSLSARAISGADPIQLPYLERIEGRINDMLITRDGRRVFWVNPVFYGLPLVEAQIIQNSLGELLIRFVPDKTFDKNTESEIRERLYNLFDSEMAINFEQVEQVPRGSNNKFKPVICNISDHS
jgi:phenylacetate-CoA ligase